MYSEIDHVCLFDKPIREIKLWAHHGVITLTLVLCKWCFHLKCS